jgi:hypothetical protein
VVFPIVGLVVICARESTINHSRFKVCTTRLVVIDLYMVMLIVNNLLTI